MENFGYLAAAYSIIFVAIFLYVLFIWRRQAALEAELRAMQERLSELEQSDVSAERAATVDPASVAGQARSAR